MDGEQQDLIPKIPFRISIRVCMRKLGVQFEVAPPHEPI